MLFLFLAYSIGMAHSIIPHSHHGFENTIIEHQHALEQHQDHVIHNDHQDEGLFDFLVCLLSEGEELASEDYFSETLPQNGKLNFNRIGSVIPTLLHSEWMEKADSELFFSSTNSSEFQIAYQSILVDAISHRGPPIA